MTDFVKISEFLPYLRPEAVGLSPPAMTRHVLAVAKSFCEETRVLQIELDEIALVAGVGKITIPMPDDTKTGNPAYDRIEPVAVLDMHTSDGERMAEVQFPKLERYGGQWREAEGEPCVFAAFERGEVYLYPKPKEATVLKDVRVAIRPATPTEARPILEIPKTLYVQYYDAIVKGVLGQVLNLQSEPWYQPDRARQKMAEFEAEIGRYRIRSRRRFSNAAAGADYRSNPLIARGHNARGRW